MEGSKKVFYCTRMMSHEKGTRLILQLLRGWVVARRQGGHPRSELPQSKTALREGGLIQPVAGSGE